MTHYNHLMETLERELVGKNVRVTLDYLDGPNELVFNGILEDAVYETESGDVKRVTDIADALRLKFSNGQVTLSGHELRLFRSRLENGFLLGDGLDKPLLLKLEEVK